MTTNIIDKDGKSIDASTATVPSDRHFRNAWTLDGKVITEDLTESKKIFQDKIREVRKDLLEAQDVAFMKALEAGDSDAQTTAKNAKTALRDAPASSAITNAKTIAELKSAWDTSILGENPYSQESKLSSQLNVDTIVDKAGSGGTNVKIGNTSTYVSDGGAVIQNTVQGLAKAWLQGSNSASLFDSFNISGGTDHGTGDYSYNLANVFSNDDYSQPSSGRVISNNCRLAMVNASRQDASTLAIHTENENGTPVNVTHVISALGDLS